MQNKIGLIVGSLRKAAYTRMLARSLPELAPQSLQFSEIEIGALPHYNQDLETDQPPPAWSTFREEVKACKAVLFVTPEYNRSIPGVLKNAVDVGSRPWGRSAWNNKPAGVISLTPGALGAMAANHHLRQTLMGASLAVMPLPEAFIPGAGSLFDDNGKLKNDETRKFLTTYLQAFETWVKKLA